MAFPQNMVPLAKLLEKDQPKVLLVVGTGISIGATGTSHASWLGLLEHGIDHLVKTSVFTKSHGDTLINSLRRAFCPFDLKIALQHAENVEINLKTPDLQGFADWLNNAFRTFRPRTGGTETIDALRDLQQAGALLLTTNYDRLLSDATGLAPVTWEEHADFLQVINRQREGILHIHGNWQRPTSVVLGRSSYKRIVEDEKFQTALRSLWLEWSWVYVGCGDGLDDPNLGLLLEWGKQWGHGALPDYFLAREDKASALDVKPDKPTNLVCVGFPDYPALPKILCNISPTARCSPFVRVDHDFALFRSPWSGTNIPFPSRQEYLDGDVPAFGADTEVHKRLNQHGWAFVLDVASVGKTTLALRMAMRRQQRDHSVFYLDLATIDIGDGSADALAALRRLSRPNSFLIVDNVHHQPELARQLWDHWRDHPRNSRLMLIGTRMQRSVLTTPAQDLAFFEHHSDNPAVDLHPAPQDLKHVMQSIYKRVAGARANTAFATPHDVLMDWHQHYGHALSAFCIAVLGCLYAFEIGDWSLPPEAAADWVREKWLDPLDKGNHENAICLAVFAAQELEMAVADEALPHPGETNQLLKLGLVVRTEAGRFQQYRRFSLREPDWGRLILAAQKVPINSKKILFETAARDPKTATILSSRLRCEGKSGLHTKLWIHLASVQNSFIALMLDSPLTYFQSVINEAKVGQQHYLAHKCWQVIERDPIIFAERARETPLHLVASFLDTAKRHGRNPAPLWQAIEKEPAKLAERAWETPLGYVASFLDTAKRHGRNPAPLWQALEREPTSLLQQTKNTTTIQLARFINFAPDRTVALILDELPEQHWATIPGSALCINATEIAARCGYLGREDHKLALINVILRRANPLDFPPTNRGFANVAWLLKNMPSTACKLVPKFLDALCSKKWLGWQFNKASCGPLAEGLRMLALHQPPEIIRRFLNIGLSIRLQRDFAQFDQAVPELQSTMVQLLGCATFCGWHVKAEFFANVSPIQVKRLPADVLPHKPEASKVEDWQFQLWLGLRAFVATTGKPLKIDQEVIDRTVELWSVNLAESAQTGSSPEHKVNSEMVQWLVSCTHQHQGFLVPPAGIGTPIAERPSHTTRHTDRVPRRG